MLFKGIDFFQHLMAGSFILAVQVLPEQLFVHGQGGVAPVRSQVHLGEMFENSRIIIEPDDEMAKAIKNSAPSKVFLD